MLSIFKNGPGETRSDGCSSFPVSYIIKVERAILVFVLLYNQLAEVLAGRSGVPVGWDSLRKAAGEGGMSPPAACNSGPGAS